jgi:hypothetical protein
VVHLFTSMVVCMDMHNGTLVELGCSDKIYGRNSRSLDPLLPTHCNNFWDVLVKKNLAYCSLRAATLKLSSLVILSN